MDLKVAAEMFFADSCVGRDRDLAIEFAQTAYEAGRQEALEEAATACDEYANGVALMRSMDCTNRARGARTCAELVRAIKVKP